MAKRPDLKSGACRFKSDWGYVTENDKRLLAALSPEIRNAIHSAIIFCENEGYFPPVLWEVSDVIYELNGD